MDTGEEGDGGSGGLETVVAVAEVEAVAKHLQRLSQVLLEEEDQPSPELVAAMKSPAVLEVIRKFVADPQTKSILIQRSTTKEETEEGAEVEEDKEVVYHISSGVFFTSTKMSSLLCLKRGGVVEADKPVSAQIRSWSLSEGSPYETLHDYVANAFAPYFKAYVKETGKIERDGDKMAPSVEKKIAELEMGLLHLQQNIDIPDISLPIHPTVAQVIKMCADEGTRPKVADFGDRVEDSNFLNQLQNGVARWIREIQKR